MQFGLRKPKFSGFSQPNSEHWAKATVTQLRGLGREYPNLLGWHNPTIDFGQSQPEPNHKIGKRKPTNIGLTLPKNKTWANITHPKILEFST